MPADPRPDHSLPLDTDLLAILKTLSPRKRRAFVRTLTETYGEIWDREWPFWAHPGQRPPVLCPDGTDWATWVLMAGRGFGKTLAGAHWLTERIATGEPLSIALVGASLEDARRVMVEGRSGLLTVAEHWVDEWLPSLRRLRFTTGAVATIFSGASPDMLRGPEHHLAWCDELVKWEKARECWDMLQFGLRLGECPRALITTTPRPGPVLRAIMAAAGTVVTRGRTRANPHVSAAWRARIEAAYAGTRLGAQELDGELLPEAGALWTPELIARCRLDPPRDGEGDRSPTWASGGGGPATAHDALPRGFPFTRTLIAVDPPSGEGTCGIVACAADGEGIGHVLADHSVTGRSPEGWARAVAAAAAAHGTTEVIAEGNQGGKMVQAVLHAADAQLRVRLVTAVAGKTARAEPIALLFEAGKVRLHGHMPELEAQLCQMIAGGGYQGAGASPDRADAMVWGLGEVMRGREARVRGI